MSVPASRRGFLRGLATLPVTGGAAIPSAPSDLAAVCLWAVGRRADLDNNYLTGEYSEEFWEEELSRIDVAQQRAIMEPSLNLQDLSAKAQFCLDQFKHETQPMLDPARNPPLDEMQRFIQTVLREVVALCV